MPEAKEEKDVTPEHTYSEDKHTSIQSPTKDEPADGKGKRRGRPPKKQEKIVVPPPGPDEPETGPDKPDAVELSSKQMDSETVIIDKEIADQMADLKKKCKAGIEIMTRKGLIDETDEQAFTKELQEYMDKGQLEYLQKMYQELHIMYFERIKEKK